MPIPTGGQFEMYAATAQIVSGQWAFLDSTNPPPAGVAAQIDSADLIGYLETRAVGANPPRLRESADNGAGSWVPAIATYEIFCLPQTVIVFDSAGTPTPISTIDADFPLGCRFNQFVVFLEGRLDFEGQGREVDNIKLMARNAVVRDFSPTGGQINIISPIFGATLFQHWSANQVFGITMGVQATVIAGAAGGVTPGLRIDQLYIQGVYNSSWINPTLDTLNANPGDTISISDSLNQLGEFSSFKAKWKSNSGATEFSGNVELPIISQANNNVSLYLPPNKGIPYGQRIISIFGVINGGLWNGPGDGEVLLARVNEIPLLTDGSGIYNLQPGKRSDTYYDRSNDPSDTIDMKIPNPYARTGYF